MRLLSIIQFPKIFPNTDFRICRVAFTVFGTDVYWYGIIITAAVALGIAYALKNAARVGVLPDNVFDAAFWGIIGGIIGARAYYVIFWNLNRANTYKYTLAAAVTGIRDGGLAIYGGLIGALAAALLAAKILKIKFLPIADLAGLGFLIGHCIGRWGNFVNQEAYGSPTNLPWGMTGDRINAEMGSPVLVHPCFLYESLWCLLGFIILRLYLKKLRTFDGEVFLLYIIWYGTGRAFIEQLRTDSLMAGGLKVSQVLSIAGALFAAVLFIYFKNRIKTAYKDTEESRETVENYILSVKIEKEKKKAVKSLKLTQKELQEERQSILAEEDDDGGDT